MEPREYVQLFDAEGALRVPGGANVRLPPGYALAFAAGLLDYPVRTTTEISVKLNAKGRELRQSAIPEQEPESVRSDGYNDDDEIEVW